MSLRAVDFRVVNYIDDCNFGVQFGWEFFVGHRKLKLRLADQKIHTSFFARDESFAG